MRKISKLFKMPDNTKLSKIRQLSVKARVLGKQNTTPSGYIAHLSKQEQTDTILTQAVLRNILIKLTRNPMIFRE